MDVTNLFQDSPQIGFSGVKIEFRLTFNQTRGIEEFVDYRSHTEHRFADLSRALDDVSARGIFARFGKTLRLPVD
ncbi:hypothetical protein HKW75_42325, partial [Pseudomonas aeruginosa]|nr:hypothetical protein [Pseudomonas aeruginosa]